MAWHIIRQQGEREREEKERERERRKRERDRERACRPADDKSQKCRHGYVQTFMNADINAYVPWIGKWKQFANVVPMLLLPLHVHNA